jgi:hypothetical protein
VPTPEEIEAANAAIQSWLNAQRGRRDLRATSVAGARLRRRLGTLITDLLAAAPRHQQAALAPMVSGARRALRASLGAAAERSLARLARTEQRDVEWLRQIAALATPRPPRLPPSADQGVRAVIVLRRATGEAASPAT